MALISKYNPQKNNFNHHLNYSINLPYSFIINDKI